MDSITQMQNYVSYLSIFMTASFQQIIHQSPPVIPSAISASPSQSTTSHTGTHEANESQSQSNAGTLDPAFIAQMEEKASAIFKRFSELDTLFASLPEKVDLEEDQLRDLMELEKLNAEERKRYEEVKQEALRWQAKVSAALQDAARMKLYTDHEQIPAYSSISTPIDATSLTNYLPPGVPQQSSIDIDMEES